VKKKKGRQYATVRIKGTNPLTGVGTSTKTVALYGWLSVRLLEELCERAPFLRTILLSGGFLKIAKLTLSICSICEKKGIQLRIRSLGNRWTFRKLKPPPTFQKCRSFLQGLSGDKKDRFQELLFYGFPEALATARYFCLKDEPYISLIEIAKFYGFSRATAAQDKMKSVLLYLDYGSVGSASKVAKRLVISIEKRVALSRERGLVQQGISDLPMLRIVRIPIGMPLTPHYIERLKRVLAAQLDGRLARLEREWPSRCRALILRFGLEDGKYRSLEEVGRNMGNITREGVRQMEKKAFDNLGVPI
jgi:hypothetical protein